MKIKYLKARNVFGYFDFDINFNNDISFLTGINGSGKTTALRLILALVTPSLRELDQIPHDSLHLNIVTKETDHLLSSQCNEEVISISIEGIDEVLRYPRVDIHQFEESVRPDERLEEHYSIIEEKLSDHPVIEFLTSIDTPSFLGLERRQKDIELSRRAVRESLSHRRTAPRRRAPFRGTLGVSLYEIQILAQEFFRKIRWRQDQLSERLREDILLSAFQYEPFQGTNTFSGFNAPAWQESQLLVKRKKEITDALVALDIPENRFKHPIDDFFNRLGRLAKLDKKPESSEFVEWLINKPQIDRISKIFEIVDDYNEKVSKLMAPLEHFLLLVNRFLADSEKELRIDTVGLFAVTMKGQPDKSIEALSSGERQILVMLAHLSFNERRKQAGVFIVDEPELSLHLKWQEIFVESILDASPSTQFILATHSPAIVLERAEKCVTLVG